jgi:hypothetical protein
MRVDREVPVVVRATALPLQTAALAQAAKALLAATQRVCALLVVEAHLRSVFHLLTATAATVVLAFHRPLQGQALNGLAAAAAAHLTPQPVARHRAAAVPVARTQFAQARAEP